MADSPPTVTVYADYVCPFCYLGRLSLDRYRETRDEPLAVDWHPFDLRGHKRGPDGEIDESVDDGKDEAYYERARENVARLQERYDATAMLDMDEIPEDVDSLDAQVASSHVAEAHPDAWPAFDDAIYAALWEDGRDVGDPDVLVGLAEDVGLDGDAVRTALDDDALRDRVRTTFSDARERGVTGVPTFVYGEYAARGAVPPEHLERLVEGD